MKRTSMVCAAALAFAAGLSFAADQVLSPLQKLEQASPGVQVYRTQGRVTAVYGKPMSPAATPGDAAVAWLENYKDVLGVPNLDLRLTRVDDSMEGKFTVFAFEQFMDGLPVDFGLARMTVLNALPGAPEDRKAVVSLVGAKLAHYPEGGFKPDVVDGATARAIVRAMPLYRNLPTWSEPELCVYYGEGDGENWVRAIRAWRFVGENDPVSPEHGRYTFFVDASTGRLAKARNEVCFTDVSGTIRGWATPGLQADHAGNPPTLQAMRGARITIGSNFGFSGPTGSFTVTNPGTTAVDVTGSVASGFRVTVVPTGVATESATVNVTPPGPADIILNVGPNQMDTAQINAHIHTTRTYYYWKDRAPTSTILDSVITANTGVSGTCNAFYSGNTINFYNAGGGCNNTAFTTVIAHEYGHFIVNRLGLAQGAFGEGFGDTIAILSYDTGIVGEFFQTTGGWVRNPEAANQQYPCASTAIHTCGQILGGFWRELRNNWVAQSGLATGLSSTQQLQVSWALTTVGGSGLNSAHPQTAIEVLTKDDDDANLGNGTPNYGIICNAFGQHGISCPTINLIGFQFPSGIPTVLSPSAPTTIPVNVVGVGGTPAPGTGKVHYRVGTSGTFTAVNMSETAPNQYIASIPATACGNAVQFYFSANSTTGFTQTSPEAGASGPNAGVSAVSLVTVADLNFNTDPGWTVTNDASLTSGQWERGVPKTSNTTNAPTADFDGSGQCWLTDNRQDSGSVNYDVDGGPTTLTTGTFNLAGLNDPKLSYARWYYNDDLDDPFTVQISSNGGTTWVTLESVIVNTPGWVLREWAIKNYVPLTNSFRVRFSATDNPNNSITEAAVDRFKILDVNCTAACCVDYNGDAELDFSDVEGFLAAYTAQVPGTCAPGADINNDGEFDFSDIEAFLAKYAAGC